MPSDQDLSGAGAGSVTRLAAAALALALSVSGCGATTDPGEPASIAPGGTAAEGTAPADPADNDATQRPSGDGWRLLGDGRDAGEAGRTEVATTDEQLDRVWREAGFSDPAPEVDWDSEVVLWFGAVWSTGRERQLTELVVEDDLVYPLTPTVEPDLGGPDDARPHAFVLAVERSVLPSVVPFNVQLNVETSGYGWPQERTVVEVDLREAGSTATDEQLHDDPALTPVPRRHVEDGDAIAVGEEVIFWFTPGECGWQLLGTFDGVGWRLSDETAPPQDLPPVEGDASLTRLDEGRLLYSIPETELIYVPAEDGWTCGP